MNCQHCEEKAVIHVTEIDEAGGASDLHFCLKHAAEHLRADSESGHAAPACPHCRITFAEFRSSGRLGCAHDYEVFGKELRALAASVHGSLVHQGKHPRRAAAAPVAQAQRTDLVRLRKELQDAVAVEDYERAAQLRDRIEGLEAAPSAPQTT